VSESSSLRGSFAAWSQQQFWTSKWTPAETFAGVPAAHRPHSLDAGAFPRPGFDGNRAQESGVQTGSIAEVVPIRRGQCSRPARPVGLSATGVGRAVSEGCPGRLVRDWTVVCFICKDGGVGAALTTSAMRTLVSSIVFHMKGVRRVSIGSSMSGDIGVDAVDPQVSRRDTARCVRNWLSANGPRRHWRPILGCSSQR
jgi:hypothetical protein